MIGVDPNTPPKRIVFRFHYYFQKVIGFLGTVIHVIPSCRQKNCVQHQLSLKNPSRWIVDTMTDTIGATMPRHFLTWILMILLGITWYKNLLMILRSLPKLSHCETRGTSTSIEKTDCPNFHTWSCLQHALLEHFIRTCRLNTQISCYQQAKTCSTKTFGPENNPSVGTLTWNPKCQQNIRPSKHQRTRQLVLLKSDSRCKRVCIFFQKSWPSKIWGRLWTIILERTWEDLVLLNIGTLRLVFPIQGMAFKNLSEHVTLWQCVFLTRNLGGFLESELSNIDFMKTPAPLTLHVIVFQDSVS